MKRLSQRFGFAAAAFSSAAVWQGLHLVSALECLIAFAVVYAITGAAQDGHARLERNSRNGSRHSRERDSRVAHRRPEQRREQSTSLRDTYELPYRPSLHSGQGLFDGTRQGSDEGWASAADGTW
jgi:hypothetical protein